MTINDQAIPRHKTAIRRGDFSLPVKYLLRDGLLDVSISLFDYGCGRGEDVKLLTAEGFGCAGWDPAHRPDGPQTEADVVNLGYVLNVIEDPHERSATLRKAWGLCRRLLAVAARVLIAGRGKTSVEFGDGVLTGRGTFQKFYDQGELKLYLEEQLQTEAIPAGVGVFYLFKDESTRQQFLANRFRRCPVPTRRRMVPPRFEDTRNLLEPFMVVLLELGRFPTVDEFPRADVLIERFGSLKRALAFAERVTGSEERHEAARRRREDLLVYLALSRFRKRPTLKHLPRTIQRDMRVFFGSYAGACREADTLLFQAGNAESIDQSCRDSKVGKLLPDALYIHRSALDALEPLLRIYEGCARAYLGEVDEANLIKLHRHSGKVSYLAYPDFDTDPHPVLVRSIKLSLRTRELDCYEYTDASNPPILHRKERFLHPSHSLYEEFAQLTQQEELHGLLDETKSIGTREGWNHRLQEKGLKLQGHQLVRCQEL
jgi:DNA phosphorothioation-associated putative methyltransferase